MSTDTLTQHFWSACTQARLEYQTCHACAQAQFYPRPFCAKCGSDQLRWVSSKGVGTVYAVTSVERAPTDEFRALQPYVIALIDLDEGFRMMAHAESGLRIGDRVSASFFAHGGRHLPRFAALRAP